MKLRCAGCGETFNPPAVRCGQCDGLLRSEYSERAFRPGDAGNIFAFRDWLPVREPIETTVGPVVYRSERLSERLRLGDLAIAFNGYAPEIGARNPTGSFKDFEALPTLLYYREHGIDALVLASAGNTARAFAHAASRLNYLTLIVVPEDALRRLWLPCPPSDAVRLIGVDLVSWTP